MTERKTFSNMKKSQYLIFDFFDMQFQLFTQIHKNYNFFVIGENLSKERFETDLKALTSNTNLEKTKNVFKIHKIVSIGLSKRQDVTKIKNEIEIIQRKVELRKSHLIVLLQYLDPSISRTQQALPSEKSFMISTNEFFDFYEEALSTSLCYHFIIKALEAKVGLEQIIAHQIDHPNPQTIDNPLQKVNANVIIPHRGELDDLEAALWYLEKQKIKPERVSVCFDELVTDQHFSFQDKNQKTHFFVNYPSGIGPYPSRDILARSTEEDLIIFHDSDDVSTFDRCSVLVNFLNENNLDAVGSHELRIDKIKKKIVAVRFPINVIEETSKDGKFAIFFPTTAIKKSAYVKTGGLSTVRTHSSDSQFYKRAYFFLNIKNIDEFLYFRVKHENSLTTKENTALNSPVRDRLKLQWENDFVKVQNQNISLLESTLIDENNSDHIDIIPLSSKNKPTILNWQNAYTSIKEQSLSVQIKGQGFPNAKEVMEDRILDYKLIKDPGVHILKKSLSWRIGWSITRLFIFLFGWIPFVNKRL